MSIDKRLDALERARLAHVINACCVPELTPEEASRRMLALVLSIPRAADLWEQAMALGKSPGDPAADQLLNEMIEAVKAVVPEDTRARFTVYQPLRAFRHDQQN